MKDKLIWSTGTLKKTVFYNKNIFFKTNKKKKKKTIFYYSNLKDQSNWRMEWRSIRLAKAIPTFPIYLLRLFFRLLLSLLLFPKERLDEQKKTRNVNKVSKHSTKANLWRKHSSFFPLVAEHQNKQQSFHNNHPSIH